MLRRWKLKSNNLFWAEQVKLNKTEEIALLYVIPKIKGKNLLMRLQISLSKLGRNIQTIRLQFQTTHLIYKVKMQLIAIQTHVYHKISKHPLSYMKTINQLN